MKKDIGSFLKKDSNRISGRLARSLGLNSPWMDVTKSTNMKKYKTILELKNFSAQNLNTIIFEKKTRLGSQIVRIGDLFKNCDSGTYNIKVVFKPKKNSL